MKMQQNKLTLITGKGISLHDLTADIENCIAESAIRKGIVTINSMHTTTALTINEFEARLLDDVRQFFHRLLPPQDRYLHNDIHLRDCPQDEPENAHSHIASMLLGNTETVILQDGKMQLGQWQSVILLELDGSRERSVSIQIMGE